MYHGGDNLKYKSLPINNSKQFKFPLFSAGVSADRPDFLSDPKYLSECKNMYFKDGLLKTRPGIDCTDGESFLDSADGELICRNKFTLTDTKAYIDDTAYSVGYAVYTDIFSTVEYVRVFLVDAGGQIRPAGYIEYNRVEEDVFYRFDRVFFVTAEPAYGKGIYAFLTRKNQYNHSQVSYGIFECSNDFGDWVSVSYGDCYTPIIYLNGRGNCYSQMLPEADPYEYEPIVPESLNLLNGKFKAYFTTDSFSDSFKLPVKNIDQNFVEIIMHSSPTTQTVWSISPLSNSVTKTYLTYQITATVNRQTGVISFTSPNGPFTMPCADDFSGNNLEIIAYKTVEGGIERIVGAKHFATFNSRLFLCGSDAAPNQVVSAKLNNLFYFPSNATVSVGTALNRVTALGVVCNKLIAFKPDEIYKIDITSGGSFTVEGDLFDITSNFFKDDTLVATNVHKSIGCDLPDTLRCCSNRLVWFSKNGKAYTLATTTYGKENNIFCVSSLVENLIKEKAEEEISNAVAVCIDGYYLLFIGDHCFVLDYRIKDFGYPQKYAGAKDGENAVSWYYWEINENLINRSVSSVENAVIFALNNEGNNFHYTAVLKGESDTSADVDEDGETVYTHYPIESVFATADCNFGSLEKLKNINEVYAGFQMSANLELELCGNDKTQSVNLRPYEQSSYKVYGIIPRLNKVTSFKLKGRSNKPISVGEISVNYTLLRDIR